jgi:hypothetical protein
MIVTLVSIFYSQKNYLSKMKKSIFYITLLIILISCNKSDFLSPVAFQKFLLAGTGNYKNTQHVWFLDSLVYNGVPYKLTTAQKQYNRTYLSNGTFYDSDGYTGKWDISNLNELNTYFKNSLTGTFIPSKWKILDINSVRFSYTIAVSDTAKYEYYFKISYN